MAQVLFRKVDYALKKLVEDIDIGEIGLPDIQRPFVWPDTKVRDLFDSMYKGYPIGYLLFWENGSSDDHRGIGTGTKQKHPRLLIVDGQQRLTSLYAVMRAKEVLRKDFRKERIFIAFCPRTREFAVADSAIRRDPEWLPDISVLWSSATTRSRLVRGFLDHLRRSRTISEDEEDDLSEAIDRLYDMQDYPLTALELSASVQEEQVADVFVRINSLGTPLNEANFILTLMSVFWDDGRTELETFCREAKTPPQDARPSPYNPLFQPDPDRLLRVGVALGFRRARLEHVYSLLRGKDLETQQFSAERRDAQFAILREAQAYALDLQHWHEFLKVLVRSGYRSPNLISSQNAVLYSYALYLIGKRDFSVSPHALRQVIARWFFAAALTGRYTSSPESRMDQDLALLRGKQAADDFVATLEAEIATVLTEDYWNIRLPNELGTASAQSPTMLAHFAALCLLDAPVLFSEMKVADLLDPTSRGRKASLERHHLFPRKYLRRIGISERRQVNQVANFALVEWSDNVEISDKPPSQYVPRIEKRFSSDALTRMYELHALPEKWYEMDYETFLRERRQRMAQIIRTGFETLKSPVV
ncbi:MAG: DUF262 domain-containing protein [Anaerolineales bacterium]